ncbi:MAG: alpha/beta hydrolase [Clostridia bacterium]|nr:alpha/beta hydrolase [Oscillospiraceae bacterium]MBQ7033898.1 alpha/beta hydrolase [Clostridia bacterium]
MEKIKLWEKETPYYNAEFEQEEPALVPYLLQDGKVHPCVIVFPGGGYHHRANHEGEPISQWLNTLGIHSFVLEYRLAPYTYKAILADALRSVRLVRHRAAEFGIDPEKIGVLGFSAGGHLAYMTALRHGDAELDPADPIDAESSRPSLAVPCYAVASFEQFHHGGSAANFLGEENTADMRHQYSAETLVTEDTPPMFLWHAADDPAVPVENALNMAKALRAKRIPFSLHVYPRGGHGKNLAKDIPMACGWPEACARWLSDIFEMEAEG